MPRLTRALALLTSIGVAAVGVAVPLAPAAAAATTIALVGDLQSELGCPGDWQPECAATELVPAGDGTWSAEFDVPAGTWQYKVAYDDDWAESYGRDGGGDNAPLTI
uniref:pullulanase X25 domain-containing protein n=1 Tax=Actinotalea sp. TaxID=1872145 RepID=UPI0035662CA0